MKKIKNSTSIIISLLLCLAFYSSSALSDDDQALPFPALIFDNTAGKDALGLISDLIVKDDQQCTRSVAINGKCNGVRFSSNKGTMQIIQNNSSDSLTNYMGVKNSVSTSTGNEESSGYINKTEGLNLFPSDQTHLFPLDKYRKAADSISNLSTTLPSGTYGTMTFERFIKNVANSTPMYGIVRVKVPLHKKNSGDRYRFCGEKDCGTTADKCGPRQGRALKIGETICGHTITASSKIRINGSLMLDFVDANNDDAPLSLSELLDNSKAKNLWYCLALPININPANASADNSFMDKILDIRDIAGSNVCVAGNCSTPITEAISYSLISQESKNEYLYKMGRALDANEFSNLPKDQQFNLALPSGYAKGWSEVFSANKLNISSATWASYGFAVPISSSTPLSEVDVRDSRFEDIPAIISTGGVFSMAHRTNISGLIYAPEVFELLQVKINGEHALQYINGAVVVKNGFYIGANLKNGSVTVISNNADNYASTRLTPKSGNVGKVTRTSNTSAASLITGGGTVDANGNLPAVDIFSPVTNNTTNPGRQWIEIKPQ